MGRQAPHIGCQTESVYRKDATTHDTRAVSSQVVYRNEGRKVPIENIRLYVQQKGSSGPTVATTYIQGYTIDIHVLIRMNFSLGMFSSSLSYYPLGLSLHIYTPNLDITPIIITNTPTPSNQNHPRQPCQVRSLS